MWVLNFRMFSRVCVSDALYCLWWGWAVGAVFYSALIPCSYTIYYSCLEDQYLRTERDVVASPSYPVTMDTSDSKIKKVGEIESLMSPWFVRMLVAIHGMIIFFFVYVSESFAYHAPWKSTMPVYWIRVGQSYSARKKDRKCSRCCRCAFCENDTLIG